MSADSWIEQSPSGAVLKIVVQPKASKTEIVGLHGDPPRLKIRVAAPPVEGEANEELLRFLKKKLRGTGAQLSLLRGDTSKMKDVLCSGVNATDVKVILTADL